MSTLTLVRHGQATPFEADPDRLSPLGQQQASLLGTYWAERNVELDEVYAGGLIRQRHTAQLVGQQFTLVGRKWPEIQIVPDLREYDAEAIWRVYVPELSRTSSQFQSLVDAYRKARGGPHHHRTFQHALEFVMNAWQQDTVPTDEIESWMDFRDRVREALRCIVDRDGKNRRVAVFTSGGPIAVAIQWAMQADDRCALEINWRVRNCSLSQFVFTRGRVTLDGFNALPHLPDTGLWSYR